MASARSVPWMKAAPAGTASANPVDRSSRTVTWCPAATSLAATTLPMYPAPPVTRSFNGSRSVCTDQYSEGSSGPRTGDLSGGHRPHGTHTLSGLDWPHGIWPGTGPGFNHKRDGAPGLTVDTEARAEEVGDHSVSRVVWDVIIVLIIVSIGGFFAVRGDGAGLTARGPGADLARRGRRGAKAARLAIGPNRFLSAVQIGMTLATLVAGAFGADTLSGVLRSMAGPGTACTAALADAAGVRHRDRSASRSSAWFSANSPRSGWRCSERCRSRCSPRRCWTGSRRSPGRWCGCCRSRSTSSSRCSAATRGRAARR